MLQADTLDLLVHFWEKVVGDLAVEFSAAAQGQSAEKVRQTFVALQGPCDLSHLNCVIQLDVHIG